MTSIRSNKALPLAFNKMFYLGDMMIHQRPGFYSSARMISTRTQNTDYPSNGEGLLSHNVGDGLHLFSSTFTEYKDIYPVWDWNRLPGTTSQLTPIIPTIYIPGVESGLNQVSRGLVNFAGGVSDKRNGVSGFIFKKPLVKYKLEARKSWHFFDDGVIALGSGINCSDCKEEVITTLDQMISPELDSVSKDEILIKGKRFISLDSNEIQARFSEKKGSWSLINEPSSKENISKPVADIWINHGITPQNATYAYAALVPEVTKKLLLNDVELFNSKDIQSVWFKSTKRLSAVFYQKGTFKFEAFELQVDTPCILMLEQMGRNQWKVAVSEPTQQRKTITLIFSESTKSRTIKVTPEDGKTLFSTIDF